MLTIGRQFRKEGLKFIIGRDKGENEILESFKERGVFFDCKDVMGPAGLAIGDPGTGMIAFVAAAVAGYSDGNKSEEVTIITIKNGIKEVLKVKPAETTAVQEYRIDK